MSVQAPRVYIDTMVFAYKLIPHQDYKGRLLNQATKFFIDIIKGQYVGITSTFTELEYKGIMKRVISDKNNIQITPHQESVATTHFQGFIRQLGIGVYDADILATNNRGTVDLFSQTVPVINSSMAIQNSRNKWKSIGGADGLIVNLAIRTQCDYLATFDTGFKGLNNPNMKTIIIPDIY